MSGRARPAGVVAYVVVFVGFLLLFFALFERFYAYPRLAKAPEDQFSTLAADGTGTYFSRGTLKEISGAQFRSTRVVRGDEQASDANTAVWDTFVTVTDFADGTPISATRERVAFDRTTSEPVHCCGEEPQHQGVVLKFPFGVQQRTYQFWDATLKRAFPLEYQGQEDVLGVHTYRFQQVIPPTKASETTVPGGLVGQPESPNVSVDIVYGNTRTVWVEPTSGIVVRGQESVRQTLRNLNGQDVITLLDGTLAYNDQTVAKQADAARQARSDLNLIRTTLPLGAAVVGLLLIVAGLVIGRGRRPRAADRDEGLGLLRDGGARASSGPAASGRTAPGAAAAPAPAANAERAPATDPPATDPAKPTKAPGAGG